MSDPATRKAIEWAQWNEGKVEPSKMSDQTTKMIKCPECSQLIEWPIKNPAGPFCPKCGGLISVVYPQTTNDEQAKYVKLGTTVDGRFTPDQEAIDAGFTFEKVKASYGKEEQPKPLLSDEEIEAMIKDKAWDQWSCEAIRDFYEAKIASGELMVVETVKRSEVEAHMAAHDREGIDPYTWIALGAQTRAPRCVVCGAKIIEA